MDGLGAAKEGADRSIDRSIDRRKNGGVSVRPANVVQQSGNYHSSPDRRGAVACEPEQRGNESQGPVLPARTRGTEWNTRGVRASTGEAQLHLVLDTKTNSRNNNIRCRREVTQREP